MSKQTILPIHINHSNVVDINNNVNNVNNNNDDDDKMGDIPCTIGQQMAGSLFGFLLSFMALLLTSSNLLVVIVMGLCVPMGTRLSGTNSNLLKINTKNIFIVIIVSLIITIIMLYVFGCSIPSLVLTSLVASFLNDPVMFMINYIMYYYYHHHHHDHHYHDKRKDEE